MTRPPLAHLLLFVTLIAVLVILNGSIAAKGQSDFEYGGVEFCSGCHPGEVTQWRNSQHANAYTDPRFQKEWLKLGSPTSCVSCHVTGFNQSSDSYIFKGVTCEQCHGPGMTMTINATSTFCGSCHSGLFPTYGEWVRSGPGHANATCVFCHQQHTAGLRYGNVTATCDKCHEPTVMQVEGSPHGAAKLDCATCHMYIAPADFARGIPAQTGHTFMENATQLNCFRCHNITLVRHNSLGVASAACLTCHGDIHALNIRLVNGTVLPRSDSTPLCGECHNQRLIWWEEGIHGAQTNQYSPCVQCHQPHDPVVDSIATLSYYPPREPGQQIALSIFAAIAAVVGALFVLALYWMR